MKRLQLLLLLSLFGSIAFAQQDMLIYNIHGIPQSSYANPSNRFDGKFFIGLPAFSSVYSNFRSTVTYEDLIRKDGDSLRLDLNRLEDENYFGFQLKVDLLSFGFNVSPSTQLMFSASENVNFNMNFPGDLFRLAAEGNAAFLGTSPDLDGLGVNFSHYREYAVGASHQLNEKLRLGVRLKYLYGVANIYTERSDFTLYTDPETYAITTETDLRINTSGLEDYDLENVTTGSGNSGFGIDLGANYQLNEKFSFSASLLDLGAIRWQNNTKTYTSKGSYTFDGVDIDVFDDDPANDDPFDKILDTLEDELGIVEGEGAYTSPLVTSFYLGGNYLINDRSFAGVLTKTDIFQNELRPSFSLSYGRKMTKWITLTAAYSVINNSYTNFGVGAIFDPGAVQFYIALDNLYGSAFDPLASRNHHLRFGINLIFGREKEKVIFPKGRKRATMETVAPEINTNPSRLAPLMEEADSSSEGEVDEEESAEDMPSDSTGVEGSNPNEMNSSDEEMDSNNEVEEEANDDESIQEGELPEEGEMVEPSEELEEIEENDPDEAKEEEESSEELEEEGEAENNSESSEESDEDSPQ